MRAVNAWIESVVNVNASRKCQKANPVIANARTNCIDSIFVNAIASNYYLFSTVCKCKCK